MAKKKKKKGGKLPYVYIDVLPEDDAADVEAADDASAAQGKPEGRASRSGGSNNGPSGPQAGYGQYPAEVISASESGLAKQPLDGSRKDEDEIVPFVIPVFRKSDIPQGGQGQQPGFAAGAFPPIGQGASPQQHIAQIQNDLLAQHGIAQRQAGSQQPMGQQAASHGNASQPIQPQRVQNGAPNAGQMGQQGAPGTANSRQSMRQPAAKQQMRQPSAKQPMRQQAAPHATQPLQQVQRGAALAQGVPNQGMPSNGTAYGNAPQGQPSSQAQRMNGQARPQGARQSTGQFSPVTAQTPRGMAQAQGAAGVPGPARGAAMGAPAGSSPASTGNMRAVAAAAAARSDQVRMHSAFGAVQAKAASQQPSYAFGPRQTVQQPSPMQATQQPFGAPAQGVRPQGAAPRQASPGSSGSFAPVSAHAPQPAAQTQPAPTVASKPIENAPADKVGDPLLDAKAIEESPMFDKSPVSIEEGMRKSTKGRKVRRRVIVAILVVLVLAGGGIGAYVALSQQGVVPQISIETKTVPVTPQGSSSQAGSSSSASSSSGSTSAPSGTGSGDLSGTVVYQYSANTASGVQYKVEETVSFQANGDCQSSTMNMTFPDAASAKTFTDNLARDYGSSFKLDSLNGENAVVTIDNSGLHLSRDEYENALRYSVSDLVVLGK